MDSGDVPTELFHGKLIVSHMYNHVFCILITIHVLCMYNVPCIAILKYICTLRLSL